MFPLVLYNGERAWLVLRRFAPQEELPELHDLPEVHRMISERIDSWSEQLRKQGMRQGVQQIERWFDRAVDAPSLSAVLDGY